MFVAFIAYEIWIERIGKTPMLRMSNFLRGRYLAINVLGLFGFGGELSPPFAASQRLANSLSARLRHLGLLRWSILRSSTRSRRCQHVRTPSGASEVSRLTQLPALALLHRVLQHAQILTADSRRLCVCMGCYNASPSHLDAVRVPGWLPECSPRRSHFRGFGCFQDLLV